MAQPGAGGPVRIHKYPNRRYYDTAASRYVTLEQLHEMIRGGQDIRVSDSRTGEDITAKVLAQIIIDDDPIKLSVIPVDLLHGLIRASNRALGQAYDKYLQQAMSTFRQSQKSMEQGVRQAMGLHTDPQAMLADWLRMMWGPLAPPSFLFTGNGGSGPLPIPPPPPEGPIPEKPTLPRKGTDPGPQSAPAGDAQLTEVIQQLRDRLAALEAQVNKQQRREKGSRRRSR